MQESEYRYIGDMPDALDGGRPLAPGEFVTLDESQAKSPYNQSLIESGKLIQVSEPESEPKQKSGTTRRKRKED